MAELVRVLVNDQEVNVSAAWAEARGLTVLAGEATHNPDGTVRRPTRKGGRAIKPKTTVAEKAAGKTGAAAPTEKAAVTKSAPDEKGTDQ